MKTKYYKGAGYVIAMTKRGINKRAIAPKQRWLVYTECSKEEYSHITVQMTPKINLNDKYTYTLIDNTKACNIAFFNTPNSASNIVVGKYEYDYKKIQLCASLISYGKEITMKVNERNKYMIITSKYGVAILEGYRHRL
ncbi:MAG: hypothetical protein K2H01_07440 [Ruminococcus sp.]|nr:hypothetical protein [Ruminococcus sp.]